MSKPCTVAGCEQGILDEFDVNTREGGHATQVVWCPVCQPHQYEELYHQDEMLELIEQVADLHNPRFDGAAYIELVTEMDRLADLAQELLAKIEGGGE